MNMLIEYMEYCKFYRAAKFEECPDPDTYKEFLDAYADAQFPEGFWRDE